MRDAVASPVDRQAPPALVAGWLPAAPPLAAVPPCDDEPLLTASERAALQGSPWFAALPLLARHDLLRHCRVRRFAGGEAVHGEGSPCIRLDAVASGAVGVGLRGAPASTFQYLPAGTWLVDPAMFTAGERRHRVVAHARTTIVSVCAGELSEALARHAGLEQRLLRLSHESLADQCEILDELSTLDLRTRLARCLRRLCAQFGEPEARGTRIALDLKQGALAMLVRASRARVNLHLKALERTGVLVVEPLVVVRDADRLSEYC